MRKTRKRTQREFHNEPDTGFQMKTNDNASRKRIVTEYVLVVIVIVRVRLVMMNYDFDNKSDCYVSDR